MGLCSSVFILKIRRRVIMTSAECNILAPNYIISASFCNPSPMSILDCANGEKGSATAMNQGVIKYITVLAFGRMKYIVQNTRIRPQLNGLTCSASFL